MAIHFRKNIPDTWNIKLFDRFCNFIYQIWNFLIAQLQPTSTIEKLFYIN